jgi:hypothetical protein
MVARLSPTVAEDCKLDYISGHMTKGKKNNYFVNEE